MNEIKFAKDVLKGKPQARASFNERYTDDILRALVKKCRQYCQMHCPLRFRIDQETLNEVSCDELMEMYCFSIEYITEKSLKYFRGNITLDHWMNAQLNIKGDYFKYMFNAYLAKKCPITGKVRRPDRFKGKWSKNQEKIYQNWLRGKNIPEMATRLKLPEAEVHEIFGDLINDLEEAGLLAKLIRQLEIERINARRWLTDTYVKKDEIEEQMEANPEDEVADIDNWPGWKPPNPDDIMLIKVLQEAFAIALAELSVVEHRLLSLKFDLDYTLDEIAQVSDGMNLGNLTVAKVGHLIDDTLKKMLPTIKRQIDRIDDVKLNLRSLKRLLMECGVKELPNF
ncbi:hypothetical protein H8E77_42235 [bacterium]|nr:hypothetical protein [bacterium]